MEARGARGNIQNRENSKVEYSSGSTQQTSPKRISKAATPYGDAPRSAKDKVSACCCHVDGSRVLSQRSGTAKSFRSHEQLHPTESAIFKTRDQASLILMWVPKCAGDPSIKASQLEHVQCRAKAHTISDHLARSRSIQRMPS